MIDNLTINFECNGITHILSVPTRDENLPYNLATAFAEVIKHSDANAGMVIEELEVELPCDEHPCIKASQWIDVEDRLPEMDKEVIGLDKDGRISLTHRVDKSECKGCNGWNIPDIEYWMPFEDPKFK